ncbi:MAG: DUF4124 domain-containing protein [Desulfobacterales bacterium]
MRSILLIGMIVIAGVTVPIASADIYFWTDENGVKNFTNYSPPEKAEVFMETSEADEDTALPEAETDRAGDADRALESGQLQAAAEEIEALREQVGELKDRLEALPEAPQFESGGAAATEAEEASNTVRFGSGYVYWPYPYGYPPYGYKGHRKPGPRHGYGRPGYKEQFNHPTGFKSHVYGRQPSQSGHGSLGPRPGYRSSRKGAYRTGSGPQHYTLGRQPGVAGGNSRR